MIHVEGDFQPRMQLYAINEVLKMRTYDVIAISVTDSEMLANALSNVTTPIITFDSDFSPAHRSIRQFYIGVNDFQIGADLASLANSLKPNGGKVCLMTALHNQNLDNRLSGIRGVLAGHSNGTDITRLIGQANWFEANRCPWNTGDNSKRALNQLDITLSSLKPDLLISTGDWAIRDPDTYREAVMAYSSSLQSGDVTVLFANGAYLPGHEKLIQDGLLHGVVSIDFDLMGKQVYKSVKVLLEQGEFEEVIHVGHTVTPKIN
ncbi:hypothetical protein AltI4_06210 [Alteromonas sp. I4]|nr:hypothetical protein AltI4_06210 [Alteromonas sp. I4]